MSYPASAIETFTEGAELSQTRRIELRRLASTLSADALKAAVLRALADDVVPNRVGRALCQSLELEAHKADPTYRRKG